MLLTLTAFICLLLVQLGGIDKSNDMLNSINFFTADLSNFTTTSISGDSLLAQALQEVQTTGAIADIYQVHLWNYCTANSTSDGTDKIDHCSKRKQNFVFDPVKIWGLEVANSTRAAAGNSNNAVEAAINNVANNLSEYEEKILGSTGKKALNTYRTAGKWMFIAYQAAFWTTLATIVLGIFAVCSRWGSLLTWILALVRSHSLLSAYRDLKLTFLQVSTVLTFLAALTSTILFSILVPALNKVLDEYGIRLTLSTTHLAVVWLAVAFSLSASLFWLFSVCCCSGRSNPHHRSNKGGLWNAEPKGQGYGDVAAAHHRSTFGSRKGRGFQAEKTGGSEYEPISNPYGGYRSEDQVPLHDYAQPTPFSAGGHGQRHYAQQSGVEPYRHA
jgi:hypothetical protein